MLPPNHDGSPHADGEGAIGDVPAAIGRLLSVTTNELRGRIIPVTAGARSGQILQAMRLFSLGLGGGAMLAFLSLVLLEVLGHRGPPAVMLWGTGLGALTGLLWAIRGLRPVPEITFVGELGVARRRGRGERARTEVVCWTEVARAAESELRIDARADGTVFGCLFVGREDQRLFLIGGRRTDGTMPPQNSDHFRRAALASWERWRTTRTPDRHYG